jgi:hypothetical protein
VTNKRLIELYNQGYSLRDLARLAGTTFQNIHQRLTTLKARRSGVVTRDPHFSSPEESEIIKRLYVILAMPAFEIGAALALSDMAIHRRLLKMGVRTRTPAEARAMKRLPIPEGLVDQVEKLRKLREQKIRRIRETKAAATTA